MRNALVVLVFSSIGVSSGFVVPSGILENLDEAHGVLTDNTRKESEEVKKATSQDDPIVLSNNSSDKELTDLATNKNRIKDQEILEQNPGKQNNVIERSFIYINQKYKTPVLNQLHTSDDLLKEKIRSSNNAEKKINSNPEKNSVAYVRPKKYYFTEKIQEKDLSTSSFSNVAEYSQDAGPLGLEIGNIQDATEAKPKKVDDLPRNYIQLLKPPLVRPTNDDVRKEKLFFPHNKNNYHKDLEDKFQSIEDLLPTALKQTLSNNVENYIFPGTYGPRSTPSFDDYKQKDFKKITNNNLKKLLNDNNEVSKLLASYLDTFEKKATIERISSSFNNDCNYKDCVLKSRTQIINRQFNDNYNKCKCGRRKNMHSSESSDFFPSKVAVISETNLTSKSSENSEYGKILSETYLKLDKKTDHEFGSIFDYLPTYK